MKSLASQRLIREICDEAADPAMYLTYARQEYAVVAAFDALCEAVIALWEAKKRCRENLCQKCAGTGCMDR